MPPRDRFEIYPDRTPDPTALEDGGSWVGASGGGMEGSILFRVGKSRDGRKIVTGLIIGQFDDSEITADTLRAIPVRALLAQLFEAHDSDNPPGLSADIDDQATWALMQELVVEPIKEQRNPKKRKRGPSDEKLHDFADIYRKEWERLPHRAMTSTAKRMHISRPTANRWAKLCREAGLPLREGD